MKSLISKERGGVRSGAGRPYGTGQYGEGTKLVRIPLSLLPVVENMLAPQRKYKIETTVRSKTHE